MNRSVSILSRRAFNRADAGSSNGDHARCRIHGPYRFRRHHERLRMQLDVFNHVGMQRLKGSQADMQRHPSDPRAGRAASVDDLRREVQPRGRRGHRSTLAREHGLIPLAIGRGIGAGEYTVAAARALRDPALRKVRRADAGEPSARRIRRVPDISADNSSEITTRSPDRIFRPGRTSASHVSPSVETCRVKKISTRPPVPCSRRSVQSRRKHARVVEHNAIARADERWKLAEAFDPATRPPAGRPPACVTRRDPPAAVARSTPRAEDNRNRRAAISIMNFGNALPYGRASVPAIEARP